MQHRYLGGDRKTQVKQHADTLAAELGIGDGQLAEVGLRYVLSHEAVSTVIAGMRTVKNVERNAATGDGRGLDAARRDIVARHRWERNFYQSLVPGHRPLASEEALVATPFGEKSRAADGQLPAAGTVMLLSSN